MSQSREYRGESSLRALPQTLSLDHVSPATRLLEKRRQMFEVQEALDAQKQLFLAKQEAFRLREEALRKKDLELQENLIKFNKFLQENESKRNRAEKRAKEEEKQRVVKEAEILKLRQELFRFQGTRDDLESEVERLQKHQDYLYRVVDAATEEYGEVQDLLSTHTTLQDANLDLSNAQIQTENAVEGIRTELSRVIKELENDILHFNNELATLRDQLASKKHEVVRNILNEEEELHDMANERKELFQVILAVENILRRCQSKKRIKQKGGSSDNRLAFSFVDLDRSGEQAKNALEDTASYIVDYQTIVEDFYKSQNQSVARAVDGDASMAKSVKSKKESRRQT